MIANTSKVRKVLLIATLIALGLCPVAQIAYAEGFPGKGDEDAWSDALPYFNRGNRYLQKEQYQQAVEDFKVAVGKYTYDPDFYTNLGVACRKVGDFVGAEDAYKKSLQLNDKDWMPWNDLANVYLKQDKLKETVVTFQRALKCNPPAKDKAAIQQDIIDINKILRMQAPPPKVAKDPSSDPSSNSAAISKASAKPNSQSQSKAQPQSKSQSPSNAQSQTHSPPAPSHSPPASVSKNADKSQLKSSGWDYVYDGKN